MKPGPACSSRSHISRSRRLIVAVSALLMLVGVVVPIVGDTPVASAARQWYVAPWGDDAATGAPTAPLRTVRRAVSAASNGDSIVLRGGTYRESVQVYRKRVHIRSAFGERAVFDGARLVDEWRPEDGDWFAESWTRQFYREVSGGTVESSNIVAGYPDQVFMNGRPVRQVLRRDDVVPGTFWHDTENDRIWIGDDPTGQVLEVSDLRYALYFNKAHGSSLTDVTVRRYATERRDMAAIRMYGDDMVVSGVTAEHNARIGLSAIGSTIVIKDSRFADNGFIGLHGDRVDTFVVERTAIVGNNKAGFDSFHSGAGLKLTSSTGVTVRDSDVSANDGPGIWTDLDTRSVTLVGNVVETNGRSGIELELSSRVNVLNNIVIGNGEAGIWVLESQDVRVLHNASMFNTIAVEVEEGPRRGVRNVLIHNNSLGGGAGSSRLIVVNDWTRERSAAQMGVSADYNAYWLPPESEPALVSRWGRWPQRFGDSPDLPTHQRLTGQDAHSLWSTADDNPHVRDDETYDFRLPDDSPLGSQIWGGAAAELGVEAGTRLPIGPATTVAQR